MNLGIIYIFLHYTLLFADGVNGVGANEHANEPTSVATQTDDRAMMADEAGSSSTAAAGDTSHASVADMMSLGRITMELHIYMHNN